MFEDVLRIPVKTDFDLTPEQAKRFKTLLLEAAEAQVIPCLREAMKEPAIRLEPAERPGKIIDVLFSHWINEYGAIRIEIWPEGLVVWVGGQIRYKSWEL